MKPTFKCQFHYIVAHLACNISSSVTWAVKQSTLHMKKSNQMKRCTQKKYMSMPQTGVWLCHTTTDISQNANLSTAPRKKYTSCSHCVHPINHKSMPQILYWPIKHVWSCKITFYYTPNYHPKSCHIETHSHKAKGTSIWSKIQRDSHAASMKQVHITQASLSEPKDSISSDVESFDEEDMYPDSDSNGESQSPLRGPVCVLPYITCTCISNYLTFEIRGWWGYRAGTGMCVIPHIHI